MMDLPPQTTTFVHHGVPFHVEFSAYSFMWAGNKRLWHVHFHNISTESNIVLHPTVGPKLVRHCRDLMEEIYAAQA